MNAFLENQIHVVSAAMSQALMDDRVDEPHSLMPRDSLLKKIQYEVESDLRSFALRIADGLKEIGLITDKLALFEPKIFTPEVVLAVKHLCQEESGLQKAALTSLYDKQQKKPIKDLVGINDQVVRALYRSGAEIYNEGRYKEAAAAFTVITLMDVPAYDAWIGLGNAEFFCQHYQSALIAYAMAAWSNPKNPMSHIHSAHCYEALKQYEPAINALDIALSVIGNNPSYTAWAKQVSDQKEHLERLLRRMP